MRRAVDVGRCEVVIVRNEVNLKSASMRELKRAEISVKKSEYEIGVWKSA